MLITVFTPTYNRAYRLPDLYESLKRQSLKDFEWLIVDDGSSDNTEEIVAGWEKEKKVPIRYFRTENGGKHRAINTGLAEARGELFFIVDSDDYLPDNSLERINHYYRQIKGNKEFAGVVGLKASRKGEHKILKNKFDVVDCTNLDIEKYIIGDLGEAYVTEILRQYPFPEYEGEKFITESVVWRRIARKYKLRYFFENIYICEYLPDGLSASIQRKYEESPKGTMLTNKEAMLYEKSWATKFRCAANYWSIRIATKGVKEKELRMPWWGYVFYPLGLIVYLRRKRSK